MYCIHIHLESDLNTNYFLYFNAYVCLDFHVLMRKRCIGFDIGVSKQGYTALHKT